jgi:hypothetical protein
MTKPLGFINMTKQERKFVEQLDKFIGEIKMLREILEESNLAIAYLRFDLEATRRERDLYKRKLLEGNNG